MAERKEKAIDIVGVDPQEPAESVEGAVPAEEAQQPSIPDITVRIYPVRNLRNSQSKLRANANVNIGGLFAVQGFRIYDSQNGLFVKEPQRQYVKDGTQLTASVFFPITKEAREKLYGQILKSYDLVMEREQNRQAEELLEGEGVAPDDDLPFDYDQPDDIPMPGDDQAPGM